MNDHLARYRGSLSGLHATGSTLVFSTEHEEGQPTGVFRFDLEETTFQSTDLETGTTALLVHGDEIWLATSDNQLRHGEVGSKTLTAVGDPFDEPAVALASWRDGVAVLAGNALHLINREAGRTTFDLGEPGCSLASDDEGSWIVAGTSRGHVCVFTDADGEFAETSRARLHDGEVTALAFSPEDLRVYSTGTDCRLLLSYVRGSFDPEDRGGSNMHDGPARAIVIGPDFETEDGVRKRFYTAGLDSTIKSWPRGRSGSQRPSTHADGVVQTTALAIVEFEGRPHLAAAGLDSSIRVFSFDDAGRVQERVATVRDAYDLARRQLGSAKPKERLAALEDLASYADGESLSIMARHLLAEETDHKTQVRGVELIATVDHDRTAANLELFLEHPGSDVRTAGLAGLRDVRGEDDVEVLRKGTDSGHEDLGLLAVGAARDLGSDAAVDLLRATLDHPEHRVRVAALTALESHHGETPDGTLAGLRSSHADVRRAAIVRLQKRGFLGDPVVDARLRRLWDDEDERARLLAFVVAMHRRTKLVKALRAVDADFHRQVFELEEFGKDDKKRRKDLPAAKPFDRSKLSEDDFRPLLEAMGSRSLDVCLRGARGLAALGDERSFGTLLQLSREPEPYARVAVCKALQVLGDPRSTRRVRAMLHDDSAEVRDAAFSALADLQSDRPLDSARAGLSAPALDVRERALALLVKTLRRGSDALGDDGRALLGRALNDSADSLRQEAFKSVLNLAPDGGGAATLRFILGSVHADVRNEVLQEAKPHPDDGEYRAIVLEILDDADPVNRQEAFDYALDRWPSDLHREAFRAALDSAHASQRVSAVEKLSGRKGDIRELLVEALADEETEVRLHAVRALVEAENRALLVGALESQHLDVRVEAAAALAALGDDRALPPLLAVLDDYHDLLERDEERAAYERALPRALDGVADLGHPGAIDSILRLLDTEVAELAAATLPGIAHPDNLDRIRGISDHESESVRLHAALALAYNGDSTAARVVFAHTEPYDQLFAALGLRRDSPERLLAFVDSDVPRVQRVALGLTLALELSEHTSEGVPRRCLSLLSAKAPDIRLNAAEALEHYSDQPAFYGWVYEMLNSLKTPPDAWKAEPSTLLALSRAIALGDPRVSVRAAEVVAQLTEPKPDAFERRWKLFRHRFADQLAELEDRANKREPTTVTERLARAWRRLEEKVRKTIAVEPTTFEEALEALSFGAYVGLTRQRNAPPRLRVAAISGLSRLASTDEKFESDAIAVTLMALGDPSQEVRQRAFEALQALGTDDVLLSTEALSTGYADMGFRGLALLASDPDEGDAILEKTLLERTDGLEKQAAKLLADRLGWVEVHRIGLGAASEDFRATCVRGLAEEYAASRDAANALRSALESRHEDVRYRAAALLARRKDDAAYDTLCEQVDSDDASRQREAIHGLQQLNDARAADVLIDRVVDDPRETALVGALLGGAVSFGDASIAPRLLALIDEDSHRAEAFDAALELTGYKQYQWVDDEDVTESWEESLRPRHPGVFAELFDLAYRIADPDMLGALVGLAKWPAEETDVDSTLHALLSFSHDQIRHRAVEMVGWRLRHRNGRAQGLRDALSGSDPLDQFYAAEGLALAGHDDGLGVLRTAVEAMSDWSLRERAVLALGRLADPSTVDMLLELANDDMHGLQRPAAEAIGHMSESERADEVFDTLQRLATGGDYNTREAALKGLRWFGSSGAWDILRRQARSDNWWVAQKCVELLRFDADSRDVVAEVLRQNDDWDVAGSAAESLRHLWGPDSLEPDYLLVQANVSGLDQQSKAIDRLRERGDAVRILEVLAEVQPENESTFVPPLVAILLSRTPLPVDEAASRLASDRTRTAAVAAQIVGRAGPGAATEHGEALVAATAKAREAWMNEWEQFLANKHGARERVEDVGTRYRRLVWACGQLHVGEPEILAAARLPDHEFALPMREDAVGSLGEPWFGDEGVTALVELATGRDARLRSMAAAELNRCAPGDTARLAADSMHDSVSLGRLLASLEADAAHELLREALAGAPGVALPRLADAGDVDGLTAAMQNDELTENVRRGAIDALGTLASENVAEALAAFGSDPEQDERLRKAAWRARRRVTRNVAAREEAP